MGRAPDLCLGKPNRQHIGQFGLDKRAAIAGHARSGGSERARDRANKVTSERANERANDPARSRGSERA
eukprot:600658-Lingulodinium_polyedra.AAC.1